MNFIEALKQLQSVIPAMLPYVSTKFKLPLFPFLNPSITQDLWPVTSILSLLASAVVFNLAKSTTKRTLALRLCFFGLAAAILSFLIINAVADEIVFDLSPVLQDYAVQIAFVFLFIGIGLTSGWCFAKIFQPGPVSGASTGLPPAP
jgi:ABC-type transport system involved in cytochrome c biogenesis permease subunit